MLTRRQAALTGVAFAAGAATWWKSAPPLRAEQRFEVMKSDEEWKAELTPEEYYVLREHGTERAGTSPLDKIYAAGTYVCAGCNNPVYSSETKFDSGTGWPSFWKPIDGAIGTSTDRSFFMTRTEVHCARCGGHLGHIFEDGPQPTGLRYCMNGVAMNFIPKGEDEAKES